MNTSSKKKWFNDNNCSFDIRNKKFLKFIIPIIFIGLLIYCSWAFIHKLCLSQIYDKSNKKATGIALIVTYGCLILLISVIWFQILIIGPGKQPQVPAFKIYQDSNDATDKTECINPPDIYQCNINGYPMWCPYCQSVKTFRSHHSRFTGYCIPKFDHYCSWLCTVIGQDNYKLFLNFLIYSTIAFGINWITTIICYLKYFKKRDHDGNLVAIVVIAGLGFFFTLGLLGSHIYYITLGNLRSIDVIGMKTKKMRDMIVFICIWDNELKRRFVLQITKEQYSQFWDRGSVIRNLKDVFEPYSLLWFIPINFHSSKGSKDEHTELGDRLGNYNVKINHKIKNIMKQKIRSGDYICTVDAAGDRYR
ncbi:palmitoyltransferase pfa5 [Maudiozyma exigua]|uniref:Palmitoyltransferase n=1 Tax=Maudiozyma exigua TaxID=34358 RepID=A0A9P6WC20_MAUEX|nr:palmitoyltransferase pfa5 [Kazachstania exigua]